MLLRFTRGELTTLCVGSFLRKQKEPSEASAETFANANASTTLYCPPSKAKMERKG